MKKIILVVLFSVVSFLAQARGSGQQIGNMLFYNDDNGCSYTIQKIGNMDFVHGSNGYSGCGQQIGSSYFYND